MHSNDLYLFLFGLKFESSFFLPIDRFSTIFLKSRNFPSKMLLSSGQLICNCRLGEKLGLFCRVFVCRIGASDRGSGCWPPSRCKTKLWKPKDHRAARTLRSIDTHRYLAPENSQWTCDEKMGGVKEKKGLGNTKSRLHRSWKLVIWDFSKWLRATSPSTLFGATATASIHAADGFRDAWEPTFRAWWISQLFEF